MINILKCEFILCSMWCVEVEITQWAHGFQRQPWRTKGAFWANVCASTWSCLSYLKPSKEKEGEQLDLVVTPSRSTPFESDPIKLMKLIKLIKLIWIDLDFLACLKSDIAFFSPLLISRDCTSLCHRVLRACQTASHHLTKCLEKMGKSWCLKSPDPEVSQISIIDSIWFTDIHSLPWCFNFKIPMSSHVIPCRCQRLSWIVFLLSVQTWTIRAAFHWKKMGISAFRPGKA